MGEVATCTGIRAEVLTPFFYHSLATAGGSATLVECISDTAFNFALAATLGMMKGVCLPEQADYRRDISAMPFRSSVLISDNAGLLPPQVRRLNLDAEAGYSSKIQAGTAKGNLKDFYRVQEVAVGAVYCGAVFGLNPFERSGTKELVVRIGKHRQGMLRLTPVVPPDEVYLNAYTAGVFGREIPLSRYLLDTIQVSSAYSAQSAIEEVKNWQLT